MTPAELAPHARATVRGERRLRLGLGFVFVSLAVVGIAVLAAAAPLAELLGLGLVFALVALLPGLLFLRWGWRAIDAHPLVVALEQRPENIRAVRLGYLATLTGHTKLATITLTDGTAYAVTIA